MTTLKKKLFRLKQAWIAFNETRTYNAYWLRHVCRYHLYIVEDDYSPRNHFGHPKNREAFIETIKHHLEEIEKVHYLGLYDKREHYDGCKSYLKHLLSFATHYPFLWFVRFRLRF